VCGLCGVCVCVCVCVCVFVVFEIENVGRVQFRQVSCGRFGYCLGISTVFQARPLGFLWNRTIDDQTDATPMTCGICCVYFSSEGLTNSRRSVLGCIYASDRASNCIESSSGLPKRSTRNIFRMSLALHPFGRRSYDSIGIRAVEPEKRC
jgi:hypothetical protein